MVRHIWLWKFADGADARGVIATLNELPAQIPLVRSWHVGLHGCKDPWGTAWDGALVCEFDSFEDLAAYDVDPFHQEVVRRTASAFAAHAVVDYEF